jgi:hypothetical protein
MKCKVVFALAAFAGTGCETSISEIPPLATTFAVADARVFRTVGEPTECLLQSWPNSHFAYSTAPMLRTYSVRLAGVRPENAELLGTLQVVRTIETRSVSRLAFWEGDGFELAFGDPMPLAVADYAGSLPEEMALLESDCEVPQDDRGVLLVEESDGPDEGRSTLGVIYGFGESRVCRLEPEVRDNEGELLYCHERTAKFDSLFVWDDTGR